MAAASGMVKLASLGLTVEPAAAAVTGRLAARAATRGAGAALERGAVETAAGEASPAGPAQIIRETDVRTASSDVASSPRSIDGIPKWKQYELRHGGQQTTMRTTFEGQEVTVRLDKPPSGSKIIDFKDYNWDKPNYQKPFIQKQVMKDFQTQIKKYQTIQPNVHLQFSQEPPSWVVNAIKEAGGTYSVKE